MAELIYRQMAIDALGERPTVWIDDDEYSLGQRNQYDCDKLAIETVPSAQPKRKHGKWIDVTNEESIDVEWKCSECGFITYFWCDKTNFCPDCGADMRGEQE